jgi:FkbM family methyltransferase
LRQVFRRRAIRLAGRLERRAAALQGRGWGAGTHDTEVRTASRLLGRSPSLVVDIGGNVGDYTAATLAMSPTAEVHVFEPAAVNVEVLRERFSAHDRVNIVPKAVAGEPGTASLFANAQGSGLASLSRRRLDHFGIDFTHEETVALTRFEDYWREELGGRLIDVCKLDIEGHELAALSGFGDALDNVDVLQFEFGGANIDTRTYFQDFWYRLTSHHFELFRVTPLGPYRLRRYDEFDECFRTTNYIARAKRRVR